MSTYLSDQPMKSLSDVRTWLNELQPSLKLDGACGKMQGNFDFNTLKQNKNDEKN